MSTYTDSDWVTLGRNIYINIYIYVCQLELFNYKRGLITGVFHMRYWSSAKGLTHSYSTAHLQFTKCDYICVVRHFAPGLI